MNVNPFLYSLKVWLSSVVVAPFFYLIIQYYVRPIHTQDIADSTLSPLSNYFFFTFLELILSFLTWVAFTILVYIIVGLCLKHPLRIWLLFAAGIILTFATFLLIGFPIEFKYDDPFFYLPFCNSFCIGWGIWFYRLD
ncbi:hypothetical protein [Mucilaginibacter sp.]|uniref:hypothetical protein n=1 Tax=Mucilaginibacter sp. TaxID=1882438 RepID=UPI003D097D61